MILADTAVWTDHLRGRDAELAGLLDRGLVLAHAWVTGELALARLRRRAEILPLLDDLLQAAVATPAELRAFVDHHELFGVGIGYVDAQLLAAALLTGDPATGPRGARRATVPWRPDG